MERLMLCIWHTTLHYCGSQLIFLPSLLLKPPDDNLFSNLLRVWFVQQFHPRWIWHLSLQRLFTPTKKYFFSSPPVCGCNNYSPAGSLKLSWAYKKREVSKVSRLVVLLVAESCYVNLRTFSLVIVLLKFLHHKQWGNISIYRCINWITL